VTDVAVGTLRLRGPAARRLARVAAATLPGALERALADVGDLRIERLDVTLELGDHDDETLAVLWADAIRARLLEHASVREQAGARSAPGQLAAPPVGHVVARSMVAEAARSWLATGASPSPQSLPTELLALADPAMASQAKRQLSREEWDRLLDRLAGRLGIQPSSDGEAVTTAVDAPSRPAARGAAPSTPGSIGEPMRAPAGAAFDRASDVAGSAPGQASAPPGSVPAPGDAPPSALEHAVVARLAEHAAIAGEQTAELSVDTLTRAAGLVLLYPWLGDHCRQAQELHPTLAPEDVREAALAAVVSDEDPTLVDDPLVRFLAGRTPLEAGGSRPRTALAHADAVAESARSILASFAALLPGFAQSTPGFVRAQWISRLGRLDVDHDPAQLLAATHPLDIVLPRLPYPVGLVKLPWSPLLSLRLR
jgi:hypothetical protein